MVHNYCPGFPRLRNKDVKLPPTPRPTLIRHSYSEAASPPGRDHAGSGGKEIRPTNRVDTRTTVALPNITCPVVTTTIAQKLKSSRLLRDTFHLYDHPVNC